MDNYDCDKLIKIISNIKKCNFTMEMDDPSENAEFARDWYAPADREKWVLVDALVKAIKEQTDPIAWREEV